MNWAAFGAAVLCAIALLEAGPASGGVPAGGGTTALRQSNKLPPVPQQALDAFLRAEEIFASLEKRPDQAAGSAQWDVAIKRLMEAQELAPRAPQILIDLGLANQLRGRSSAAAAWLKAATIAIERTNPDFPDLPKYTQRIAWLMERPGNQMELALTFAKGEVPFIHAQTLPDSGVNDDIWPPRPTPPMGPVMVKLPNGQYGWNPMYFNADGTSKPTEISAIGLQEFLIRLKLGIGDESGIEEAVSHFDANYSDSVGIERSHVRVNAYNICLQSLLEARSWAEAARLAGEAAEWCRNNRTAWTSGQDSHFREIANDALGRMQQAGADNLGQWIALAKELAASDDEIYFDAKIDRLRQMTVKGEALMEGLASAVRPIGHNFMRLRSIAD